MDYHKIYNSLIERCKTRDLAEGYTERHHIVPRCLGGNNNRDNLVVLTAREHFIAHHLLCKVHTSSKLWFAFCMMKASNSQQLRYFNGRTYSKLKEGFAADIRQSRSKQTTLIWNNRSASDIQKIGRKVSQAKLNMSIEEKQNVLRKRKTTIANKSPEEKSTTARLRSQIAKQNWAKTEEHEKIRLTKLKKSNLIQYNSNFTDQERKALHSKKGKKISLHYAQMTDTERLARIAKIKQSKLANISLKSETQLQNEKLAKQVTTTKYKYITPKGTFYSRIQTLTENNITVDQLQCRIKSPEKYGFGWKKLRITEDERNVRNSLIMNQLHAQSFIPNEQM